MQLINSLTGYIGEGNQESRFKAFPIDPINAIVNIGLIAIKPTKFCFYNHGIYLGDGVTDRISRNWRGDSRNDISELTYIFRRGARLYQPHKNKVVSALFKFAIKGLESLATKYPGESNTEEALNNRIKEIREYCTKGIAPIPETERESREFLKIWPEAELTKLCNLLFIKLEGDAKEETAKAATEPSSPAKPVSSTPENAVAIASEAPSKKNKKQNKQEAASGKKGQPENSLQNSEAEKKLEASMPKEIPVSGEASKLEANKNETAGKELQPRKISVEVNYEAINRSKLDAFLSEKLKDFTEIFDKQCNQRNRYLEEEDAKLKALE